MNENNSRADESMKLEDELLEKVSGGVKRSKYGSAFYCEYCKKTIRLNFVRELDKAKKEHNAKIHPGIREPRTTEI